MVILVLLSILMHGYCLDSDEQFNSSEDSVGETCTEALCLLQQSVTLKSSQASKRLSGTRTVDSAMPLPLENLSLLETGTVVHVGAVDEKVQILLGLFLFMVVAAIVTVVCALVKPDHGDEDAYPGYTKQDEDPERPMHSEGSAVPSLNASWVVPPRTEAVYYIPDISQAKRRAETYDITDQAGKRVMGVLVKEGGEDPGILVHGVNLEKGGGTPVAFVDIHPDALRHGQLRIASPSSDHPRGKLYGILERIGQSYAVSCDGESVLQIKNHLASGKEQIRVLTTGMGGRQREIGTSSRKGNQPIELHLQSGADGALAVICHLAIQRME